MWFRSLCPNIEVISVCDLRYSAQTCILWLLLFINFEIKNIYENWSITYSVLSFNIVLSFKLNSNKSATKLFCPNHMHGSKTLNKISVCLTAPHNVIFFSNFRPFLGSQTVLLSKIYNFAFGTNTICLLEISPKTDTVLKKSIILLGFQNKFRFILIEQSSFGFETNSVHDTISENFGVIHELVYQQSPFL